MVAQAAACVPGLLVCAARSDPCKHTPRIECSAFPAYPCGQQEQQTQCENEQSPHGLMRHEHTSPLRWNGPKTTTRNRRISHRDAGVKGTLAAGSAPCPTFVDVDAATRHVDRGRVDCPVAAAHATRDQCGDTESDLGNAAPVVRRYARPLAVLLAELAVEAVLVAEAHAARVVGAPCIIFDHLLRDLLARLADEPLRIAVVEALLHGALASVQDVHAVECRVRLVEEGFVVAAAHHVEVGREQELIVLALARGAHARLARVRVVRPVTRAHTDGALAVRVCTAVIG